MGRLNENDMKKEQYHIKSLLIVTSLVGLAISSCTEELADSPCDVSGEEVITLVATTPDCEVKTILGDESGRKSIGWAPGDSVRVFYGTGTTNFKDVPVSENGEINFRVQTSSYKNFFSVYPYATTAKMVSDSVFNVTVPSEQSGLFKDACIMAAYSGKDRLLRFRMAASLLAIDIADNSITKVVLRANDGTPIAGKFDL